MTNDDSVTSLSRPVHITDLYCFNFTSDEGQLKESGWEYFKLESEFKRMRVPNDNWTLYDQTLSYEVSAGDEVLQLYSSDFNWLLPCSSATLTHDCCTCQWA